MHVHHNEDVRWSRFESQRRWSRFESQQRWSQFESQQRWSRFESQRRWSRFESQRRWSRFESNRRHSDLVLLWCSLLGLKASAHKSWETVQVIGAKGVRRSACMYCLMYCLTDGAFNWGTGCDKRKGMVKKWSKKHMKAYAGSEATFPWLNSLIDTTHTWTGFV